MRLRRAYSILASLLLITMLMIAAGCQDEDLPPLVNADSGRNGGKNSTPTPTPSGSAGGSLETPPPSTAPGATPQSLTITPGTYAVNASTGGGIQLGLQIKMSDNSTNTLPSEANWTSSDPNRATVTNGWVTVPAGAGVGTVTITATAKNSSVSGTATITITSSQVTPTAQSVVVSPSNTNVTASVGATVPLTAEVTMSDLNKNSNVSWTSSNTARATVNAAGVVTVPPGSTSETVTITATALNSSVFGTATITISTVPAPTPTPTQAPTVTGVAVTSNKDTISVGPEGNASAAQLMARLTMSNGDQVLSSDVDWTSSNLSVASISAFSQVVVPPGAPPGTHAVTFTAKARNTSITGSVTVSITILKTITSITINPPAQNTLFAGSSLELTAFKTMSDNSTETSGITWTTSNSNLATVTGGLVSVPANLIGTGTVTITASAGGRSASVVLTVRPAPSMESIAITPKTVTINASPASGTPASGFVTSAQLTVTATLTDGSSMPATNVNWTSADSRSLRVSSTGVVTAPSTAVPGTYRVTAQVKGTSLSSWADVTVRTDGRVNIIVQ